MGVVSSLYKIARIANDVGALASGNSKRIGKRVVNKAIRPIISVHIVVSVARRTGTASSGGRGENLTAVS
jgi:hypothetical protein